MTHCTICGAAKIPPTANSTQRISDEPFPLRSKNLNLSRRNPSATRTVPTQKAIFLMKSYPPSAAVLTEVSISPTGTCDVGAAKTSAGSIKMTTKLKKATAKLIAIDFLFFFIICLDLLFSLTVVCFVISTSYLALSFF